MDTHSRDLPPERISKRWVFASALASIGAMWFASRALLSLHVALRTGAWWFVIAFALGALVAGATISRHHGRHGWREPVIGAVIALAFFGVVGLGGEPNNSVSAPVAIMAAVQLAVTCVLVVGASLAGALLGRRVTSAPSTPAIIVLSGLIMNGTSMATMGAVAAFSGRLPLTGAFVVLLLVAIVVAGFLTQALLATRRPWTCASGGLLMLLLVIEDGDTDSIAGVGIFVGFFTLLGWIGARIAVRVYRARWGTPAMPAARAIER